MRKEVSKTSASSGLVEEIIFVVRSQKVILDQDLGRLYEVETRVLVQAVKRNLRRFPSDFMFRLSLEEYNSLQPELARAKHWGGRRTLPYAFTEQGVAMASTVLKSERAILVNIEIMRAFVRLRELSSSYSKLAARLEELEKKYDISFKVVFDAINRLMGADSALSRPIGFNRDNSK